MVVALPHVAPIAGAAALVATLDYRLELGAMALLLLAGAAPLVQARRCEDALAAA
jgi:hypothetical protein